MANSRIIPEEWEKVRRAHCLPLECPRVVGCPPGPPKDRHCEACASAFLDKYWENLLHGTGEAQPQRDRRPARLADRGRQAAAPLIVLPGQRLSLPPRRYEYPRHAGSRWRPALFALGFCTATTGAILVGLTSWAVPGIIALVAGISCLVATAAAQG
jgi:hypothetical protein